MDNYKYETYTALMQKIKDLEYAAAVLHWDMETYMPSKGVRFRSQQMATLQALAHELFTAESTGILLNQLIVNKELNEIEPSGDVQFLLSHSPSSSLPLSIFNSSSGIL